MSVRPTRRGYAVVVGTLGALLAGAAFGPRALDAVVLPGIIALVAAAVQVVRAPTPSLERTTPPADVPGTARSIEVALEGNRTYPATVRDRLPPGVDTAEDGSAAGAVSGRSMPKHGSASDHQAIVNAAIGGDAAAYDVVPTRRGRHVIGHATVAVTDVLGLLERSVPVDVRDAMLVFPRLSALPTGLRADLRAAYQAREANQRDEFEDLREYVRGDALRDIHWKSSARHDELMVMEFTDRADPGRVTVAAGVASESAGGEDGESETTEDRKSTGAPETAGSAETTNTAETTNAAQAAAETMAEAAASVCVSVIRDGTPVRITTPSGSVEASPGRLRPALGHLAVAEGGPVPTRDADVVIVAHEEWASIRFDGREHRFERVTGDGDTLEAGAQPEQVGVTDSVGSGGRGRGAVAVSGGGGGSSDVGAANESGSVDSANERTAARDPEGPK